MDSFAQRGCFQSRKLNPPVGYHNRSLGGSQLFGQSVMCGPPAGRVKGPLYSQNYVGPRGQRSNVRMTQQQQQLQLRQQQQQMQQVQQRNVPGRGRGRNVKRTPQPVQEFIDDMDEDEMEPEHQEEIVTPMSNQVKEKPNELAKATIAQDTMIYATPESVESERLCDVLLDTKISILQRQEIAQKGKGGKKDVWLFISFFNPELFEYKEGWMLYHSNIMKDIVHSG